MTPINTPDDPAGLTPEDAKNSRDLAGELADFAVELHCLAYTGSPDKEAPLLAMADRMRRYAQQAACAELLT